MNKYFLTTPIYYVNDKPHIGHAYTTIIADVVARYYRQKLGADKVFYLTGTDEHGAKIAASAAKLNKTPQEFCDEIAGIFKTKWQELNLSYNHFVRTTDKQHETVVQEVLTRLKSAKTPLNNDVLYEGEYEGLYCVGCESYVKPEDLVDGKCPFHNKEPELIKERNWYFRLSDYADILKEKITNKELRVLPEQRETEVLSFIEHGLEDIAISREKVEWGIPIPFDTKQTTYVWIDALVNYISALQYPAGDDFKKYWPANVQFLAKDILKFHCLIWPALLLALDLSLPNTLFVHGFFTLNGQKMSKTLGNVIDPSDMVAKFGVDATRYLIISQFPFGDDGDVKQNDFVTKFNADLANGLGNLVSRVIGMTEKYCELNVPKKQFAAEVNLNKFWQNIDRNYQDFKINENIKAVWDLISWCDGYIDSTKPWSLAKEGKQKEVEQILYNLLEIIRNLAISVEPFLPDTAKKIGEALNCDLNFANKEFPLKPKTKLNKIEPLFLRK